METSGTQLFRAISAFGNASGSENVGALIGLNNNGGAGNVSVINNSAFGASIVNGKDTGNLIGLDNGTINERQHL